eukprot:PhF_6_TR42969/c0_g1_i6/m.65403
MGSTCLLDDVLMTVDGSRSTSGPGGFLHVAGGGRTIVAGRTTNTDATNVTLSCREGSYISAGIGVGGGGGCIYVDNGSVDVDVRGCDVRDCLSCMGPGLLSRGDEAGNVMLVSTPQPQQVTVNPIRRVTFSSFTSHSSLMNDPARSCNVTQSTIDDRVSSPTCRILYTVNTVGQVCQSPVNKISNLISHSSGTSQAVVTTLTGGLNVLSTTGTVLSPPDVVVGAQILRTVWSCASSVDKSTQQEQRRPYLSLGGWVSISKSNAAEWELMLLMCSGAVVYCVHGLLTWVITVYRNRKKCIEITLSAVIDSASVHAPTRITRCWYWALQKSSYPSYSIQYNVSLLLPLTSTLANVAQNSSNYGFVVLGMAPVITLLMIQYVVLKTYNVLSFSSSSQFNVPLTYVRHISPHSTGHLSSCGCSLFLSNSGYWVPRVRTSLAGPLFSSYAPISSNPKNTNSRLPFVWFWITMFVGVVSTIVASISEFSSEPQGKLCGTTSVFGGVVFLLNGLMHIVFMRTMMVVRSVCLLRGVRMVLTGVVMILLGITQQEKVKSDSSIVDVNVIICFSYGVIVCGGFETVCAK